MIVEGLTSEGILGLDFLERHQCTVDTSKGIPACWMVPSISEDGR